MNILKQKKNYYHSSVAFMALVCNRKILHVISIATSLSVIEDHSAHAMFDGDELAKAMSSLPANAKSLRITVDGGSDTTKDTTTSSQAKTNSNVSLNKSSDSSENDHKGARHIVKKGASGGGSVLWGLVDVKVDGGSTTWDIGAKTSHKNIQTNETTDKADSTQSDSSNVINESAYVKPKVTYDLECYDTQKTINISHQPKEVRHERVNSREAYSQRHKYTQKNTHAFSESKEPSYRKSHSEVPQSQQKKRYNPRETGHGEKAKYSSVGK